MIWVNLNKQSKAFTQPSKLTPIMQVPIVILEMCSEKVVRLRKHWKAIVQPSKSIKMMQMLTTV